MSSKETNIVNSDFLREFYYANRVKKIFVTVKIRDQRMIYISKLHSDFAILRRFFFTKFCIRENNTLAKNFPLAVYITMWKITGSIDT